MALIYSEIVIPYYFYRAVMYTNGSTEVLAVEAITERRELSKFPFDVIAVFFPAPYVNLTTNIL
jgi:hypothetical protein